MARCIVYGEWSVGRKSKSAMTRETTCKLNTFSKRFSREVAELDENGNV